MKSRKIRLMCITGIFTAIVFVFTAYLQIPSHTGYIHVGDAFIYLAACILPLPYAMFTGAVGALLADILTGFAIWAPASVIIKAAAVLFFSRRAKMFSSKNLLALIPASIICIGGYYLYESIIMGNFIAPAAGIPGYVVQSLFSVSLFIVLGLIFDKTKLVNRVI